LEKFEALKLNALWSVYNAQKRDSKEDFQYIIGRMFRWYFEKYHTPLADVEDLPLDHVVETYWLSFYEDMAEADAQDNREGKTANRLKREIERAVTDPEELARRQREEDAEDAEIEKLAQEELRDKSAGAIKQIEQASAALKSLSSEGIFPKGKKGESVYPSGNVKSKEEDIIRIKFEDVDFDEDVDSFSFGLGDPGKK
jgi:hypothetical protein